MDILGDFGFVGGDDEAANRYQDNQQTINWFVEVSPNRSAKVATSLLGAPGLIQLCTAGQPLPQSMIITPPPGGGIWTADSTTVTADSTQQSYMLPLTEEQIATLVEHIANRVLDRVIEQIDEKLVPAVTTRMVNNLYQEAGRIIISKLLWAIGICAIGFCVWIVSSGKVKVGLDP